jgi:predicted Zn-ribbon and HTH transcriptional regulator
MNTSTVRNKKIADTLMDAQCVRCNWSWVPRIIAPKQCPHCKSYDWKQKNLVTNEEND